MQTAGRAGLHLFFMLSVGIAACASHAPSDRIPPAELPPTSSASASPTSSTAPATFDSDPRKVANQVLAEYVSMNPSMGRALGKHEYDGKVADYSRSGIAKRIARLEAFRDALSAAASRIKEAARDQREGKKPALVVNDDDVLDVDLMLLQVEQDLFHLVDLSDAKKRPTYYEELFSIDSYLNRDYAPLDERVKKADEHLGAALAEVPSVLQNLEAPLSQPIAKTAVMIYRGYAEYYGGDALTIVGAVKDEKVKASIQDKLKKMAAEATKIADHLEKVEVPRGDQSHVLGAERYKKLLRVQEALDTPLAEIEKMGEADLLRNKKAYEELFKKTKPTRPTAAKLLQEATRITQDAKKFVEDKKIVTIPGADRVVIKETPPFMRYNSAFLDPPGPYDKDALPAFYYITPPDPKWPKKEQEEYLMPLGTLLSTSVHEVWPGHYLQGLFIRKAPTDVQKSLGSYSFIEGWAHYVEEMMIEEGLGAKDPQNHLGQLSDALLRNCRVTASLAIHTQQASLDAVAKRFVDDCKQDAATAKEQANRGTFDPGYFAYTLGKIQILELRAEAKKKLGAKFDLRRFHDALLSHGSPPIPMIRERVLREIGAIP